MPSTDAIMWAAIAGLILIMLGVIGFLLSTGFAGIKAELAKLWVKFDSYQIQSESNARDIARINERCQERHANHRRSDD